MKDKKIMEQVFSWSMKTDLELSFPYESFIADDAVSSSSSAFSSSCFSVDAQLEFRLSSPPNCKKWTLNRFTRSTPSVSSSKRRTQQGLKISSPSSWSDFAQTQRMIRLVLSSIEFLPEVQTSLLALQRHRCNTIGVCEDISNHRVNIHIEWGW